MPGQEKRNKGKIGIKREIDLEESTAILNSKELTIKGKKGEVKRELKLNKVSLKLEGGKILLESKKATKESKKTIGSLAAHIKNMIKGSRENHVYTLKICAGHFPMNVSVSDGKFIVKNFLGEKVPRVLKLDAGAEVKIDGYMIYVTSPSKELAGQLSARIEQLTRRPGFDTRVFQDGLYIVSKDGKELK